MWAGLVGVAVGSIATASPGALATPVPQARPDYAAPAIEIPEMGVLSAEDVRLYHDIFEVQKSGKWKQADGLIMQLDNEILMGHVLYQRYMHPTAYRSKYHELRNWMSAYADHPDASRIYRLAKKRKPKKAGYPKRPEKRGWRSQPENPGLKAIPALRKTASKRRQVSQIKRHVRSLLRRERPTQALNYVNGRSVRRQLTSHEYNQVRQWIANSYYLENVDKKALKVANDVLKQNAVKVPRANWTAGLAAWRLGEKENAATYFHALAEADNVSPALRAAGAYWAARAYLVTKQPDRVTPMLEIAAQNDRAFYGILARKQLGISTADVYEPPKVSLEEIDHQMSRPAVKRAIALAQVGRFELAEEEMRRVHGKSETKDDAALLILAMHWKLPSAQMEIANYSSDPALAAGLYPLPEYEPKGGYKIDKALVFAFIRQESKFNTRATSRVGARGLMQLMPRTASYISKDRSLRRANREKLFDPAFNLMLGQKYIETLRTQYSLGDNLFHLLVAYNGGPGNFRRWQKQMNFQDDPLLFIESIPSRETRGYVEAVFTNLWMYRSLMGQDAPTLDSVASGQWPSYISVD